MNIWPRSEASRENGWVIILDTLLLLSNFFPKIDSLCEREKEVEFSLLNHFMTSEKNDWLQLQLWKV